MSKSKKVSDEYFIDEGLLQELASKERKGTFFEASLKFYNEVKDKEVRMLSEKQKNWLWELSSVLHDRAENKRKPEPISQSYQKKEIEKKPEGLFSRIIGKISSFFE